MFRKIGKYRCPVRGPATGSHSLAHFVNNHKRRAAVCVGRWTLDEPACGGAHDRDGLGADEKNGMSSASPADGIVRTYYELKAEITNGSERRMKGWNGSRSMTVEIDIDEATLLRARATRLLKQRQEAIAADEVGAAHRKKLQSSSG